MCVRVRALAGAAGMDKGGPLPTSFTPLHALLERMARGERMHEEGGQVFGVPALHEGPGARAHGLEQHVLAFRQRYHLRGPCRAELFRQTNQGSYLVLFKIPRSSGGGVQAYQLAVEWQGSGALGVVDLWKVVDCEQLGGVDPAAQGLKTAELLQGYLEEKFQRGLERVEPEDATEASIVRAVSALFVAKGHILAPWISTTSGRQTLAVLGTPFLDGGGAIHVDALHRLGALLQGFLAERGCSATVRIPGPITRWLPRRAALPEEGPGQWPLANERVLSPPHSLYVCGGSEDGTVVRVLLDIRKRRSVVEVTLLEARVARQDMIMDGAIDVHDVWGGHHLLGVMMSLHPRVGAGSSMACLTEDVLAMIVGLVRQGEAPLLFGGQ